MTSERYEELYGRAWAALAKKEKHKQGVPVSVASKQTTDERRAEQLAQLRLYTEELNLTVPEIAERMGLAESTVRDHCKAHNLRPRRQPLGPNAAKRIVG